MPSLKIICAKRFNTPVDGKLEIGAVHLHGASDSSGVPFIMDGTEGNFLARMAT